MKLEDIRIGMKVKLLGKHGFGDRYDNIEDWYSANVNAIGVSSIMDRGYGIVKGIDTFDEVVVDGYTFMPEDLEPYEELPKQKTPKEWLLTQLAVCTDRDGDRFIVLANDYTIDLDTYGNYCDDLDKEYDDNLVAIGYYPNCDIMKIEYNGQIVWKRKEYVSFDSARKSGKKFKHKDWEFYQPLPMVLELLSSSENINKMLDSKEWEVEGE